MDLVKAAYLLLVNVENTDITYSDEYHDAILALSTLIEKEHGKEESGLR